MPNASNCQSFHHGLHIGGLGIGRLSLAVGLVLTRFFVSVRVSWTPCSFSWTLSLFVVVGGAFASDVLLDGEGGGDGIGTHTTVGIFGVVMLTGDVGRAVVGLGRIKVGGWVLTCVLPWKPAGTCAKTLPCICISPGEMGVACRINSMAHWL